MKRLHIACLAGLLSFCCFNGLAQTDSAYLNLGRSQVRKDFTQNITIKGADLYRMPFANLTEAINVWLHGAYSSARSIAYVVDGVLAADVNQYSIYDIEEVTLVQQAQVQLNGAINQQQLVLVKTKRTNPGKSGFTVAGQSFLVKQDDPVNLTTPGKSETNFYHQYHIGAHKNGKNLQYGISVNYLRDVNPYRKDGPAKSTTTDHFNRYRMNGWLNARLDKNNLLSISMSYVPQPAKAGYIVTGSIYTDTVRSKTKEYILNPSLSLHSTWLKGLHNDLTASYAVGSYRYSMQDDYVSFLLPTPNHTDRDFSRKTKIKNIVAANHTRYNIDLGNWQIEPALNFMFRYIELRDEQFWSISTNGLPSSRQTSTMDGLRRLFLLTPSANIFYKNSLNLQGGFVYDMSDYNGAKVKKVFPFASVTADVLKIADPQATTSLKIFGSWAHSTNMADISYPLTGYHFGSATTNPAPSFMPGVPGPILNPTPMDSSTSILQTGATFQLPGNRLMISYNYEKRDFTTLATYNLPIGTGYYTAWTNTDLNADAHRLGIMAKVIEQKAVTWFSGLNITTIKLKTDDTRVFTGIDAVGDYKTADPSWTGGFTNRVSYKGIKVGADLLYHFDQQQLPGYISTAKTNSLVLQNVYAGYQFSLPKGRTLEVYADCRNLTRNEKSTIRDRKFYGLGFKAQL
jgi:hypothetical protein